VLNFRSWTFFFGMAFLAGLYSLHRLSGVRETGEVRDRVVLQQFFIEARRSMGNLSSAAGLARIVRFPMLLVRPRTRRPAPGD